MLVGTVEERTFYIIKTATRDHKCNVAICLTTLCNGNTTSHTLETKCTLLTITLTRTATYATSSLR